MRPPGPNARGLMCSVDDHGIRYRRRRNPACSPAWPSDTTRTARLAPTGSCTRNPPLGLVTVLAATSSRAPSTRSRVSTVICCPASGPPRQARRRPRTTGPRRSPPLTPPRILRPKPARSRTGLPTIWALRPARPSRRGTCPRAPTAHTGDEAAATQRVRSGRKRPRRRTSIVPRTVPEPGSGASTTTFRRVVGGRSGGHLPIDPGHLPAVSVASTLTVARRPAGPSPVAAPARQLGRTALPGDSRTAAPPYGPATRRRGRGPGGCRPGRSRRS